MRLTAAWIAAALWFAVPLAAAPSPDAPAPGAVLYPASGKQAQPFSSPAPGGGFGWAASLFICVGAGGGAWFWWRARKGAFGAAARDDRKLAIAETRPLGNRQYLVVADYAGRKYLLGVCPGRIEMLAPLDGIKSEAPRP